VKKEEFDAASAKQFEHLDKFMSEHEQYFDFDNMDHSKSERDASRYFGNKRDDSEMFLAESIGLDRNNSSKTFGTEKLPPLVKKNTWEAPSRSNNQSFQSFFQSTLKYRGF